MTDVPNDFDADATALHVALLLKGWTLYRRNPKYPDDFHGWCFGPEWSTADWTIYYTPGSSAKFRIRFWDMAGQFTATSFDWVCTNHIEVLKLLNTELPWIAAGNYPRGGREE